MTSLKIEVNEALSKFTPSEPVYRVQKDWYSNSISLSKKYKPATPALDCVSQALSGRVEEYYDAKTKSHVISHRSNDVEKFYEAIRYDIKRVICNFINKHQGAKNNKLTTLYRWYNHAINNRVLENNTFLEQDLFNIFKWLCSNAVSEQEITGILQLLALVQDRYEQKGIRYSK